MNLFILMAGKAFFKLLQVICNVDTSDEEEQIKFVAHVEKITEYPVGSYLIYYPKEGEDYSPAGIFTNSERVAGQ